VCDHLIVLAVSFFCNRPDKMRAQFWFNLATTGLFPQAESETASNSAAGVVLRL